ncbi:MAG: RdgB/HAM1 family non-canonical purine NTP pyrophosphatase [Aeromonadaceae bacterium]|nr:RdgB/HAM1 family non-canonical purine NTP pyrophosphatase [Aeromonadaceae bacterium]
MNRIVLASNNKKKVAELNDMLLGLNFKVMPQSDFLVESVPETGSTFVENAIIKARHAARITGLPALADDSGLEVDALHGAPGVYSARFAGDDASDEDNLNKLLDELSGIPPIMRSARYWCVLAFLRHADDPTPILCQASWEGQIITEPKGENGFGYDPVFFVPDTGCTAAQLPPLIKNQSSHRAKALKEMIEKLQEIF